MGPRKREGSDSEKQHGDKGRRMEKLDTGTWEVGGSQAPEATTGKGRMTSLGAPEPGPDVPPHMEG